MGRRIFQLNTNQKLDFDPLELEFPRHIFPCLRAREEDFHLRVDHGAKRMLNNSVVFCSCVRDVAEVLPLNIRRLEKVAALFKDYRIVVVENDSEDRTVDILNEWSYQNPRVKIISEVLGNPRLTDESQGRMSMMALYRNKYLSYVRENWSEFDFVIVTDLDFKQWFDPEGIKHSFSFWGFDCMSANGQDSNPGIRGFYDLLPYYETGFSEEDCFVERRHPYVNLVVKKDKQRPVYVKGMPFKKIHSGFGGLAIYPTKAFLAGEQYRDTMCDHATLAETMWANDFTEHYINPSMIGLR